MNCSSIIKMENVTMSFDDRVLFENFSLTLEHNETVGITGPSGCGKSTLLRIATDLVTPTSGTVLFEGQDILEIDPRLLRRRVVLVPQEASMFPGTVRDNLLWGLHVHRLNASDDELVVALREVNLDSEYMLKYAANLSGGEKQRVALARALLLRPSCLLLDEPTSALDEESTLRVESTINSVLKDRMIGVLIVTHSREQAERFTSRVVELIPPNGGKVNAI